MNDPTPQENWLLSAYRLDGKGGGHPVSAEELDALWADPASGSVWVHLRRDAPEAQAWLRERSGFDEIRCERLLAEETRPGAEVAEDHLEINLRGINLNPGAEPEDMVSLRASVMAERIVTLRLKPLRAVKDVEAQLQAGRGPRASIDLLQAIATRLAERTHSVIANLEETVDTTELALAEPAAGTELAECRRQLAQVRRRTVELRRYIAPQREALSDAAEADLTWLKEPARRRLRLVRERASRLLDDLDSLRERAAVTQDETAALQAERMNRTMYALAVVAGIFLPLSFLTGLLGINVGGMPGVDDSRAFWVVCALLAAVGVGAFALFKRKGWM